MTDTILLLDPKSIFIDRDKRQRKVFTTDDLEASIPRRGQLTPIIVDKRKDPTGVQPFIYHLIAGERRLTTFLAHPEYGYIKAIAWEGLDDTTRQIIELEENFRRQDLSWIEQCDAILTIHELYMKEDSTWSLTKTAEALGEVYTAVYRRTEVAKEIRAGNERAEAASDYTSAYRIIEAQRDRQREHAKATLQSTIKESFSGPESETYRPEDVKAVQQEAGKVQGTSPSPAPTSSGIDIPLLNVDALKFMKEYDGVPFNFGHCDFPYGINYQDMDQAHTEVHGDYDDSPEVYWELLGTMLSSRDRLFSPQAHFVFWFSPKLYVETLEFFARNAPDFWVQDIPLVWLKSDNRGILADPSRRPRNITEFAFLITRGDRKIVKAVSNAYSAPTSKVIHGSEKPIPVLKHFFQMLVDPTTRMFDPTAGSANALVAALDFSPASMLGLEKDEEFFTRASQSYKKYATLKALEKKNG